MFKKLLKASCLLLACALLLGGLCACGDTPQPDGSDAGEDLSPFLDLIKDGKALFNVVYNPADDETRAEVSNFIKELKKKDINAISVSDSDSTKVTDVEILVGASLRNREEYKVDTIPFGPKGFTYFVKDSKVVIAGGSDGATADGLKAFVSDVLNISGTDDLSNLQVDRTVAYTKTTNYRIKSVTIDGTPLSDFTIVSSEADYEMESATYFRDSVYNYTGCMLQISDTPAENNIIFKLVDNAGKDGYKVYVSDGDLIINCSYFNTFMKGTEAFVSSKLVRASGDLVFDKKFEYTTEVSRVYYKDFGAVGDGRTDDFKAIKAAHNFANIAGHTVVAEDGATYNMGTHAETINVQTNVIWTGARFTIDDSTVERNTTVSKTNIFTFARSIDSMKITTIATLSKGQTNIGVTFDEPKLIFLSDVENDDRRVYIRWGMNSNSGSLRQEVILVDENGNVDPSTPILWDYPEGLTATAYSIAEKPITAKGGTFTTICNRSESKSNYYARGLKVNRSNTTIENVKHYVTSEPDPKANPSGACPYTGFYSADYAHNVTFKKCLMTGHTMYKTTQSDGDYVSQGSYDTQVTRCNLVTWEQCTQSNDILDSTYWGVMASNFSKNLKYDGCTLSRFDAHQGMHNTTIINSELGHQKINAIGSGLLRIEDCTVNGNNVVVLRSDYGSTWEGDVIIKNVYLNNSGTATLLNCTWYNHKFGYTCYLPKNVTVDNVSLNLVSVVYVFAQMDSSGKDFSKPILPLGEVNENVIVMPEKIIVRNNLNNYTYKVSSHTGEAFANVELIKE